MSSNSRFQTYIDPAQPIDSVNVPLVSLNGRFPTERRLAAILAADMVGWSRLTAADETGTIERRKAHRTAPIDPQTAQYGGPIVKTTADGMLREFHGVVDAVPCAVEIQRAVGARTYCTGSTLWRINAKRVQRSRRHSAKRGDERS